MWLLLCQERVKPEMRALRAAFSPAHWQIFFTRPTLRLLRNRFPETCH